MPAKSAIVPPEQRPGGTVIALAELAAVGSFVSGVAVVF
jgi:hypothetical protein